MYTVAVSMIRCISGILSVGKIAIGRTYELADAQYNCINYILPCGSTNRNTTDKQICSKCNEQIQTMTIQTRLAIVITNASCMCTRVCVLHARMYFVHSGTTTTTVLKGCVGTQLYWCSTNAHPTQMLIQQCNQKKVLIILGHDHW